MKNSLIRLLSIVIPCMILTGAIAYLLNVPARTIPPRSKKISVSSTQESSFQEESEAALTAVDDGEMIGVWVPFMTLDMDGTDRSEKAWTDRVCRIFDDIGKLGANTVIFHIRPFSDALYDSSLFPCSHLISGQQGIDPGYDPLSIAIREAHKRGLQFHAWINPLRIKTVSLPPSLSDNNPYYTLKSSEQPVFFKSGGNLWWDPSSDEVRRLIIYGVREIVEGYDVDGIQIDDYFYPSDDPDCDIEAYQLYCSKCTASPLDHSKWRIENINLLVSGIYSAIHSIRNDCVFGISPQCNIENDILMGADIKLWLSQKGYADYICPQAYVSEEHPFLPFGVSVKEWIGLPRADGIRLYFGIAAYKLNTDADDGTWLGRSDNLAREVSIVLREGADGFMLYAYDQLFASENGEELKALKEIIKESQ